MSINQTSPTFHRRGLALVALLSLAVALPAGAASAASLQEARIEARQLLADLHHGFIAVEDLRQMANTAAADPLPGKAAAEIDQSLQVDPDPLVGTWVVHVPAGGGAPAFDALQTFDVSGTFVETSSLLATQTEGPAHGSWRSLRNRRSALLTFELFAFENGEAIGRIRVRCRVQVSRDSLDAVSVVDLILPDGEVVLGIGSGPFSATRMPIVAP